MLRNLVERGSLAFNLFEQVIQSSLCVRRVVSVSVSATRIRLWCNCKIETLAQCSQRLSRYVNNPSISWIFQADIQAIVKKFLSFVLLDQRFVFEGYGITEKGGLTYLIKITH